MDGESYTAQANKSGAFSVALTGLTEGSHYLKVADSADLSGRYRLVVDTTASVITSLKAALGENGNAAVSWTYTESNLKTFLLYRDDVLIQGSESSYAGYTDTNYIAVQAAGATFTLVAVDKAGNRSEASETASLSTAELKFTDSTGWATEYIKVYRHRRCGSCGAGCLGQLL